jgi:predicted RNA polymerase sigma factor
MAEGPARALPLVEALSDSRQIERSHLLPGVRGELLTRLGRIDEARTELEQALALCSGERERDVIRDKIAVLDVQGGADPVS